MRGWNGDYRGALLFSERPRKLNRGASLKIGEFDEKGVLRREDILDAPLVLLHDLAVDTLFEKFVPPRFTYEGVFRKLVYPYPRDGIRELIVNAVVHMDYHSRAPVAVSVHPDHLEIFGVGGLPDGWTVETLVGKHKSVPRNQTLADVFHDAGYVENWAQGIGRVMESCRVNGNPPNFVIVFDGLSATVTSSAMCDGQPVESSVIHQKQMIDDFTPTDNQRLILDIVASDPSTTQKNISERTGLAPRTVALNLSKLVDAGVICREGSRKKGVWRIIRRI